MTGRPDTDSLLRYWFGDGPSTMPDRVIDVVADRIGRQPQRRARRLDRRLPMNRYLRFGAALAAVLAIAVVGWSVLPRNPAGVGQASPSPTLGAPSPSPASSPGATAVACDGAVPGCLGALSAGAHETTNFAPAFAYQIPAGWLNTLDRTRTYTFGSPGHIFEFQVLSQNAIPDQGDACAAQRKAGVGNTVADWITFLTTHPGLVASVPEPESVGGYDGMRVSFHVASTWTKTCPRSIGPAVMLVIDNGTVPERVLWIDDQYTTFDILDVRGETVIIRLESASSTSANTRDQGTVQPIIDSIRFFPTP